MIFKKYSFALILFYLLFFTPLKIINAASLPDNLIEFSLSFKHQTSDFNFPGNTYQAKTDLTGINWYEPFNHYFHGGLELGYIDMSQINNPLTSAQISSGKYIGILLRFLPINSRYLVLTLNLNYRYNKTESKSTDQDTTFSWHETLLFSELELRPFDKLSVLLAAEYQDLTGDQRDSGNVSQITPFSNAEQLGYRFGINYSPYPTADIGIEWLRGDRNGGGIYFKRRF